MSAVTPSTESPTAQTPTSDTAADHDTRRKRTRRAGSHVQQTASSAHHPDAHDEREGPENEILEGEARRKQATAAQAPAEGGDPKRPRAEGLPQHVRERFIEVDRKYYFPTGDYAFRDHGAKFTTRSENTEIVRTLIEAAKYRGWDTVTVAGTERFRKEAWMQASLVGLRVRGYRASEVEKAQLVRALDKTQKQKAAERSAQVSDLAQRTSSTGPETLRTDGIERERTVPTDLRVLQGRLLAHGHAPYQFERDADPSYYLKLKTQDGERVVWGKDFERALRESLSQVKAGDEVSVLHLGQRPVTVTRTHRDAEGNIIREEEVSAYRNSWRVETRAFLRERAELARLVRDASVDPKVAASRRPELIGTYMELEAARLISEQDFPDLTDRARFVERVRHAIATEIERGESLAATNLRDPAKRKARVHELAQAHVLS